MAKKILYSVEEAAEALSLGRSTLLAMAYDRLIPSITVGRRRLFPVDELQKWAGDRLKADLGADLRGRIDVGDDLG